MTTPFVLSKLQFPRLRLNPVTRPRLIERLNEGLRQNRKLTLITAPAGFGKTTLVTEWLNQLDQPFAWISLEEEDNDPVRFLALVAAALQTIDDSIGCSIQSILQAMHFASPQSVLAADGETSNFNSIITTLINDLIKTPMHMGLILDDYHLISHPAVHLVIQSLLEHQPFHLHLVVITREDPPFPLPRMRVRSELAEIREHDLRFTKDEAAAFLTGTMGLDLSDEAVTTLDTRTEGWIAGLQMAALSLEGQNAARVADLINTFSGTHHYVIDFLAEEVLRRQPQNIQQFMCQTAILDRMCSSLCDAVTESDNSQAILFMLERSNLFLTALDDQSNWYRYHHLFRDFLRTQLQPYQQPHLHQKASAWHEAHGLIHKAVEHALAAGDMDEAARVIGIASRYALHEGQLTTMLKWLDSLPEERVRASAELVSFKGWGLVLMGKREAAEAFAEWAMTSPIGGANQAQLGIPLTLQAYLAVQRGDNANCMQLAQQALAVLDKTDPLSRTFYYGALLSLGHAQREIGDTQAAIETFRQAISCAHIYGVNLANIGALEELCLLLHMHGLQEEAATLCRQAIDRCVVEGKDPMPMLGIAYIILAMMCYESDELTQAYMYVNQGLELCQQLMMPMETLRGQILLAFLLQAAGKDIMATAMMKEARQTAANLGFPRFTRLVEAAAVDLHLQQERLDRAAEWAEKAHPIPDEVLSPEREAEYRIYARLLLKQKRFDEMESILAHLAHLAWEKERFGDLIDVYVLQAQLFHVLGRRDAALEKLEKALRLASPRGYYRAFLNAGSSITELLSLLRSVAPEMVDRLLNSINTGTGQWAELASTLVDPLSARELEVLQLMAGGLSNREAAQALFVTEDTIKKHLSHIYEKLAVKNRTHAVARAREMGLLV